MITPTFAQQVTMEASKAQEKKRIADNTSPTAALEKKDGHVGTAAVTQSSGHCAQVNNNDRDNKGNDNQVEGRLAAKGTEDEFQEFLFSQF